jgi:hypothetical protein
MKSYASSYVEKPIQPCELLQMILRTLSLSGLSRGSRGMRFSQVQYFYHLAFLRVDEKFFSKILQKQRDKRRKACVVNYFPVPLTGGTRSGQGGTKEVDSE